jgi:hypothetical protein
MVAIGGKPPPSESLAASGKRRKVASGKRRKVASGKRRKVASGKRRKAASGKLDRTEIYRMANRKEKVGQ